MAVASQYLELSNAHEQREMLAMFSDHVSLYGADGIEAAGAAQRAFYDRHGPSLRYEPGELRELRQACGGRAAVVEFPFVRLWEEAGASRRWDSREHGLVERIHVAVDSGLIVRIEVVTTGSAVE